MTKDTAGKALYEIGGLRFWSPAHLFRRTQIEAEIVQCVSRTLLETNQMFYIGKVEAPLMMPRALMNEGYTDDEVFALKDSPHTAVPYGLRAETTEGTYRIAREVIGAGVCRPPLCLYQSGPSFRRETNDGASAAKLRFNQFNQLEFQIIVAEDTTAPLLERCRDNLLPVVDRICDRPVRLVPSDRLPAYATETVDIEVDTVSAGWREVASTSKRTDWPQLSQGKPLRVLEIAFGLDRMVALST